MKSTVLVSLLAIALTGCQVSVRLGGADSTAQHTHRDMPPPSSKAVSDAVAEPATALPVANAVEACPSLPPPVECSSAESPVKASTENQPSAIAANTENADSKEPESNTTNIEEQAQQAESGPSSDQSSDKVEVAADEKANASVDSFDIDKYVEQSASCVQQNPCNQPQVEVNNSQEPKAAEESKPIQQSKSIEQAKSVSAAKSSSVESGIQRVDRRRYPLVKRELPPDMPR